MLFSGKIRLALPRARSGLRWLAVGLTPLALAAADTGSTASPPAPSPSASSTPPPAAANAPLVVPDSVPDNVNPFAGQVKPVPLKLPTPLALKVDIHPQAFDGLTTLQMFLSGPDFNWMFDPLNDWILAPAGYSESAALVYKLKPEVRLSLTLYPADFMSGLTSAEITQYLAAVREPNPDDFVLLSPIPPGAGSLEVTYFSNFRGQGVAYAITGSTVLIHHQWFVDLNKEYVLVIDLTAPPALLSRLDSQVRFTLGRSRVLSGLGTVEPKTPAPAPAADSGTAPAKPTQ